MSSGPATCGRLRPLLRPTSRPGHDDLGMAPPNCARDCAQSTPKIEHYMESSAEQFGIVFARPGRATCREGFMGALMSCAVSRCFRELRSRFRVAPIRPIAAAAAVLCCGLATAARAETNL